MSDVEGEGFYLPATDETLFEALRPTLDADIERVELYTDSNEDMFQQCL